MLGILGFTAPTFLMMLLLSLLFRKVPLCKLRKERFQSSSGQEPRHNLLNVIIDQVVDIRRGEMIGGGEKHSGGSSSAETRQGNEALAIVLTISVCL